ncbi:MAG TPA: alpha/beta hydrolase [Bryobacteraceae bacterium]|nr:alpha/beta hydrolase [Bryobacteraceae bacterium]
MKLSQKISFLLPFGLMLVPAISAQQRGGQASCAAPDRVAGFQPEVCRDHTPHKQLCVPVDRGVALQVLDWGGADKPETMVLLTGYGDNAHVYDQFAFQFTDYFHVIGITRRGFLPSSQPEEGYDVRTRARDDIEVLKYLGINKAVFVGHSLSASELSQLGLEYKSYVSKLVYLDAFDLARRSVLPELPTVPYQLGRDDRSIQAFVAATAQMENSQRPFPSICPAFSFDARGRLGDSTTPDFVGPKLFDGIAEMNNPLVDWANIDAPRLGILSVPSVENKLPFYWYLRSDEQAVFDKNWPGVVRWFADTTERFKAANPGKPTAVVHLIPEAPHYFFLSDQATVVRVMREFLLGTANPGR